MPRKIKKKVKKVRSKKASFKKELVEEIEDAEKWIKERRKFFIKLGWLIGAIIIVLLIIRFI